MAHYAFVYDSYVGSPIPESGVNNGRNVLGGIATTRQGGQVTTFEGISEWPNSVTAVQQTATYSSSNSCPGPDCTTYYYYQNYVYTDPQGGRHNLDLRWDYGQSIIGQGGLRND